MPISYEKLKQVLLESGLVTPEDFEILEKEVERDPEILQKELVRRDLLDDEELGQIVADILDYPFVNLRKEVIPEEVLNIIPELMAKKQQIVTFKREPDKIHLAMADPKDLQMIRLIEKKTGVNAIPYYATPYDIEGAIEGYRSEMMKKMKESSAKAEEEVKKKKGKEEFDEERIIEMVKDILIYAYQNDASDIHIEPREKSLLVRYRIDGILHDVLNLKKIFQEPIITRIKVLSKLRTDEHFAAQDGRFSENLDGEKVDMRVSVMPITQGEKVVIRLLSEKGRELDLESLGFSKDDLKKTQKAIDNPYGMILATGPTGYGKTTTMYAVLKILNKRTVNISTIEDPIEYDIEGVNQVQVNKRTGITFSKGLRSLVRQDPDIIMVGEIRDEETAAIAVNAAMTGHLVLSTLHTNNAATTLPRLIDMKIEPFLIASTVNIIIAQRLVRRICPRCISSYEAARADLVESLSEEIVKKYFKNKKTITLYKGQGCELCSHSGYKGRVGIFEVLEVTESIKQLIMRRANAGEIEQRAIEEGMDTMFEDGMEKVVTGTTTIEEVLRVIKE